MTTARTRLRVVRRLNRLTRNLAPRRFIPNLLLELVERQFVQTTIHVRAVLDRVSNPTQVLEHDNRIRELLGELDHNPRHSVKNPLGVAFFFLPELVVDRVLATFLTAFRNSVVALTFGFHRAVIQHECSERVHRLTMSEGGILGAERFSSVILKSNNSISGGVVCGRMATTLGRRVQPPRMWFVGTSRILNIRRAYAIHPRVR